MRLSAPKQVTWIIAVILGIVGVVGMLGTFPVIAGFAFWLVVAGWVLLVLATLLEGL
jgi:heme A synthase